MRVALLTFLVSVFLFSAENKSDLELAYEQEFAFLELQKQELQKRLKEIKKRNAGRLWSAERSVRKLQDAYIGRQEEAENISNTLHRITIETEELSLNKDIIGNTLMQSENTLQQYNPNFTNNSNEPESIQLEKSFFAGQETILALQSIRKENGTFFLSDGKSVEGTIVKVGNIASYGITGEIQGILAPAGGNKLKIWNVPASESANKLYSNGNIEILDIFLYESLVKEVSERKEKTVLEVVNSGGLIGWVIVGLGAFAVFLTILRALFLQSASGSTDRLYGKIKEEVENGRIEDALEISHSSKTSIANVMNATLRNIDRDRQHLDDIISEAILHESGRLDKYNMLIMIIAAVAPLLGLLGTVTGMITTFDLITEFGTGDPKMLSGGISEALVTTELGLIVAIPSLIFGNLLSGWAETIKDNMEHVALKVSNKYSIYLESKQTKTEE
jgi:biopolymer transport protein ExbB